MLPTLSEANRLLAEAEACNPGPWGNHSRVAAHCARMIASRCPGMDGEKAYVLGLLHDIGRKFGVRHLGHVSDGYSYMLSLGYDEAARICLLNNIAAAMTKLEHGETLKLVQMQGFVQSAADFHEQPAILNGASELAVQILGENGKHARTAVGVSALPKNAAVEISCTFEVVPEEMRFTGRMNWIG